MSTSINIKDIPVQNICCGNIILYLDQLWKITKIKLSSTAPCINFHAERQTSDTPISSSNLNKDTLHLSRVLETTVTIVENV